MRTSVVGAVKVNAAIFDSVIQFGDNLYIQAKTNALAIQRERAEFDTKEDPMESFPAFRRTIPQLSTREDLRMYKKDTVPFITVGGVRVLALSTSAILLVGSNRRMELESRIKHIRHFLPRPGAAPGTQPFGPGLQTGTALVPLSAPGP